MPPDQAAEDKPRVAGSKQVAEHKRDLSNFLGADVAERARGEIEKLMAEWEEVSASVEAASV